MKDTAKKMHRLLLRLVPVFLIFLLLACLNLPGPFVVTAKADSPTDEIEHFRITVDVREDASLQMTYQIDWRVLDDDAYGPLTWVDIGVPNSSHTDITALSSNIEDIEDNGDSLEIYLDREYFEDELVSFAFSFVQDRMYQIGRYVDGETVFVYTPAWFDEIEVKDLTIRWNADKAGAWQPDCLMDDGYLVFSSALSPGERYQITVAYPDDAFAFSRDRQADGDTGEDEDHYEDDYYEGDYFEDDPLSTLVVVICSLLTIFLIFVMPVMLLLRFIRWISNIGTGFGNDNDAAPATEKKIVRTKIEYYETCPGCGAGRVEGKDECPYCKHSMIKSKEVVEEKDLVKPEAYSRAGTYRYGNSPNTYIHVNVIPVPVSRPRYRHLGGSRRSGGGSRPRSSCASACAPVPPPGGLAARSRSFSQTGSTAEGSGSRAGNLKL
ncbi:MAG: hypothetical protein Q4C02_04330 [Eubacteriales bacterium]|nr:hypothetical protein [Eubacteriales bacterium]